MLVTSMCHYFLCRKVTTVNSGFPLATSLMSKMKMADGSIVLRRNRSGTKAENFCRWPDEPFEEMDNTLAVQQYIQQLKRHNPANIDLILKIPESQDESVWKYEHLE